jgi:hypothetical protein
MTSSKLGVAIYPGVKLSGPDRLEVVDETEEHVNGIGATARRSRPLPRLSQIAAEPQVNTLSAR